MKWLFFTLLSCAVFATSVQIVIHQHSARKLFIEVQLLESQSDAMSEEWGRLQLEQSTWATNDRIETVSRNELEMKEPDNQSLVLLIQ